MNPNTIPFLDALFILHTNASSIKKNPKTNPSRNPQKKSAQLPSLFVKSLSFANNCLLLLSLVANLFATSLLLC